MRRSVVPELPHSSTLSGSVIRGTEPPIRTASGVRATRAPTRAQQDRVASQSAPGLGPSTVDSPSASRPIR